MLRLFWRRLGTIFCLARLRQIRLGTNRQHDTGSVCRLGGLGGGALAENRTPCDVRDRGDWLFALRGHQRSIAVHWSLGL